LAAAVRVVATLLAEAAVGVLPKEYSQLGYRITLLLLEQAEQLAGLLVVQEDSKEELLVLLGQT
jgi:hypothetical protein